MTHAIEKAIKLAEEGQQAYKEASAASVDVLYDILGEIKDVLTSYSANDTEALNALGAIQDCFADLFKVRDSQEQSILLVEPAETRKPY